MALTTVSDFFGLTSSALVPISSDSGDTYRRVAVAHWGKYEKDPNGNYPLAAAASGKWRNPRTTYLVKADTTIAVQLGKGFAPSRTGNVITRTGYMITMVEIVTAIGAFPTVTVSGVANEGANSINNFTVNANKFNVSVPVVARARAQNLLGAVSGGGYLQGLTLRAVCDPVVCEENMLPCASDIVNGRYEINAETLAPNGEAAPTMAAANGANGGFALTDLPRTEDDGYYRRYSIQARREMY